MTDDALAVANQALTEAKLASNAIAGHERQCAERWAEARDEIKGVKAVLETFRGRFIAVLFALIGLLVAMIGYLLVEGPPWWRERPAPPGLESYE